MASVQPRLDNTMRTQSPARGHEDQVGANHGNGLGACCLPEISIMQQAGSIHRNERSKDIANSPKKKSLMLGRDGMSSAPGGSCVIIPQPKGGTSAKTVFVKPMTCSTTSVWACHAWKISLEGQRETSNLGVGRFVKENC